MSTPPLEYELNEPLDGSSWAVRENLAEILQREIHGPLYGDNEVLSVSPDVAYVVGRIAPKRIQRSTDDPHTEGDSDEVGDASDARTSTGVPVASVDDTPVDSEEDAAEDQAPRRGLMIPASMGLRCQVPIDQPSITVHASWGVYHSRQVETEEAGRRRAEFHRTPVDRTVTIPLASLPDGPLPAYPLEGAAVLQVELRTHGAQRLVELALCNDTETPPRIPVSAWLFQTKLSVEADQGAVFLPVRDPLTDPLPDTGDLEDARLELQYRNRLEFAAGRTCSVDWHEEPGTRRADRIWTTWLPTSETPQVEALTNPLVLTDMKRLASSGPDELRAGLTPIVDDYRRWLDTQRAQAAELPEHLRPVAEEAIDDAAHVADRLERSISFLVSDETARQCFAFMNRVMADQRIHSQVAELRSREPDLGIAEATSRIEAEGPKAHSWRLFQLAFVLLQIPAMCDPGNSYRSDPDLAQVELLFFPTGGGKTEAYLGLAAFTFAIRRRQGILDTPDGRLDGTDGLAVLMRYTLRLLTAQQFQRASTLMCAAELARRENPELWGETPFRIGLWVGSNVSPKTVKEADEQISSAHDQHRDHGLTVLQIKRCPWCGTPLTRSNVKADPTAGRVYVRCANEFTECPFSEGGEVAEGLPVLTVDEEIYRLTPAMVIATVDKFARLAREGSAASLFGRVSQRCSRHGYVHPDDTGCTGGGHRANGGLPAATVRPTDRLRPPDLIIQDELHLITGALGTTVGLFELAIDELTSWRLPDGRRAQPLIVASSATVRNANDQVRGLYGRKAEIFPPQVLDAADTYFSKEVPISQDRPGRRYLGICASGVRLTAAETRIAEVLMAGAQLLFNRAGAPADPYMTLVGYFNATRELAGMTRLIHDNVETALVKGRHWSKLPRRFGTGHQQLNVEELTSRINSSAITNTLDLLGLPFDPDYDTATAGAARSVAARANQPVTYRQGPSPLDAVLATSMLQVGVDVTRLGLMLLVGQPKNTAEYIQASSRVGRDARRPGLVISLGNWARPRDLAHFESFRHYHETFYSQVEALSVTPYSTTSITRGIDGVLVAAARVSTACAGVDSLSPERGADRVEQDWDLLTELTERLAHRATLASGEQEGERVRQRLTARVAAWRARRADVVAQQKRLAYEKTPRTGGWDSLMMSAEQAAERHRLSGPPFDVPNSMREVQPEINLLVSPDPDRIFLRPPLNAPEWVFAQENED